MRGRYLYLVLLFVVPYVVISLPGVPEWLGRLIATSLLIFLVPAGAFWSGLSPKTKILEGGKLDQPQYDKVRPIIKRNIRILVVACGVFFSLYFTYPLTVDLVRLAGGEKPLRITVVAKDVSVPVFGVWFLNQSVRVSEQSNATYNLYYSLKPVRVGESYEFVVFPYSRLILQFREVQLYFVPIGSAPTWEIDDLVLHYREKFGIKAHVLPPMTTDASEIDAGREQLIAEDVIQSMLRHYPEYAEDKSAVLIGITGQDMYPRGANWRFCFGWRIPEARAAVVSTVWMDLHYEGEPPTEATVQKRLRKVVTKDIGIMTYGKTPNDNPNSVLYNNILGIEELDQVSEDF